MLQRIVLNDPDRPAPMVFENPVQVFVARVTEDVLPMLAAAEKLLETRGGHLAGFVSFDAAPAFDASFVAHQDDGLPLLCLGLFESVTQEYRQPGDQARPPSRSNWNLNTSLVEYTQAIARIHDQIERGNTYQINYTVRYSSGPDSAPHQLDGLARDARYGAVVELESQRIVSASPELFFALQDDTIVCKPMKGTAKRGLSREDDLQRKDALQRSEKDRAENVMITDMVRNDLGRIAEPGSVHVSKLCDVEQHPTVWQMTSTVAAKTQASISQIFKAMFPSASVTGAPKSASLGLIRELEPSPRGVYTGAIGYFSADRHAQFNVAIRTACINQVTRTADYGVGSGIIWDSVAEDEFRECQLKAEILQSRHQYPPFALLETMRWSRAEGVPLLDAHLQRLAASAAYFGRAFRPADIRKEIERTTATIEQTDCRLRLLLSDAGLIIVENLPLPITPTPFRLRVARQPVDQHDPFLYHKTTHRDVYANAAADLGDSDDVLLWNKDGLLTETCIANIFVHRDGEWLTPPVDCGLLAGVMRAELLRRPGFREARIRREELSAGQRILLCNAVRGEFFGVLEV